MLCSLLGADCVCMDALGHAADREAAGTSSAASWPTTSPTGTTQRPQRQLVALGSALGLLPVDAPAELEQAAAVVERATRSRVAADLGSTLVMRRSVQAIWCDHPQERDGAGFVMLVDALLTAVGPAMHWHRRRQQQNSSSSTAGRARESWRGHARLASLAGHPARRPSAARATTSRRDSGNTLSASWPTRSGTHSPPRSPRQRQQDTVLDQALGERTLDDSHRPSREASARSITKSWATPPLRHGRSRPGSADRDRTGIPGGVADHRIRGVRVYRSGATSRQRAAVRLSSQRVYVLGRRSARDSSVSRRRWRAKPMPVLHAACRGWTLPRGRRREPERGSPALAGPWQAR